MRMSLITSIVSTLALIAASESAYAGDAVSDEVIAGQRAKLAETTDGAGFGPQSPRDIDVLAGENRRIFEEAPDYRDMNLCNIHFHENAEHRGGDFTTYAGNGDGKGAGTGYRFNGTLSAAELAPLDEKIGETKYGDLAPGDTIEVHYVHTTAQITPGPTLGACLSESIMNPQLRVEAQVYVLVNDPGALDFRAVTQLGVVNGKHQALNIPGDTGAPVRYAGSTTGPGYNEKGSPLQVTWSVRPRVAKVDISTMAVWLKDNEFDEAGAHGVRNLVLNPALLSPID